MRRTSWQLCSALLLVLGGCGPSELEPSLLSGHDLGEAAQAITWNGSQWQPTAQVLAAGDQQSVTYNGSPTVGSYCTSTNPWACSCSSHPACSSGLPGTLQFANFLKSRFPQITSTGGLGSCCRQVAGGSGLYLSVHSLGRAVDLMISETSPGVADNSKGDPIAAWLIQNAQAIGVQYIAWDQAQWSASKSPGARYGPYAGSLSHTNHLHVELNLAGANKQTPFFTSGAINGGGGGGATCTARCNGSVIIQADCGTGDCAAYGATCIADPNPRCVYAACPPTGKATVCLDSNRIANCENGLFTGPPGECAAFGCFCSTAGVAPTAARCVLSLCVSGPTDVPRAHVTCSLNTGKKLDCKADGSATEVACPTGKVCSVRSGTGTCVAPVAACPIPAAGQVDDRMACLPSGELARCFNGNIIDVDACGEDSTCTTLGGDAHCASRACIEAGNPSSFCAPYGAAVGCDARGMLTYEEGCAEGTTCQVEQGRASCVPVPVDAGTGGGGGSGGGAGGGAGGGSGGGAGGGGGGGRLPDGGTVGGPVLLNAGCGCQGGAGSQPFSALALLLLSVRQWHRSRASARHRSLP
ncbi:MAG: hypothetical protein RL653_656 [Pseudomonadota bacterium]|jgi:hypothetical protein